VTEIFNNRELATIVWLAAFFFFALTKNPDILHGFRDVLKIVLSRKISLPFFALLLYNIGSVFLLSSIGFWNFSLLKDTLFWFLFAAISMVGRVVTSEERDSPLIPVIADNFKIILFLEFLLNAYTFPFYVELIFVPFSTLIVLVTAYMAAQKRTEDEKTVGCLQWVQVGGGVYLLGFSVWSALADLKNFLSPENIVLVTLPAILSTLLFPALFIVLLLVRYENLLVLIKIGSAPKSILRYAMRRIIRWCGFSIKRIRLLHLSYQRELMHFKSKQDVDHLIIMAKSSFGIDQQRE
jgi:hypothetical protein